MQTFDICGYAHEKSLTPWFNGNKKLASNNANWNQSYIINPLFADIYVMICLSFIVGLSTSKCIFYDFQENKLEDWIEKICRKIKDFVVKITRDVIGYIFGHLSRNDG